MSYVTAVTDRTAADIAARNSKAFINVADRTRIYNNSYLVNALASITVGNIEFNTVSSISITSIPTITEWNTILENIENIRFTVSEEDDVAGISKAIKHDWEAGASKPAPDYKDANLWERTLDLIWTHFGGPSLLVCPTLAANLTVTTGNQQIYIDCLDAATFDMDLQGNAQLHII